MSTVPPVAAPTTLVTSRASDETRPRAIRPPGRPTNAPTSSITAVTVTARATYAETVTGLLMSKMPSVPRPIAISARVGQNSTRPVRRGRGGGGT